MEQNENFEALLSALCETISDSELLLSAHQSDIAAAIAAKRISMKMNQAAFAKMLNVSQGMVSRWESGMVNFTLKTLVELSQKLAMKLTVKLEDVPASLSCSVSEYQRIASNRMVPASGYQNYLNSPCPEGVPHSRTYAKSRVSSYRGMAVQS